MRPPADEMVVPTAPIPRHEPDVVLSPELALVDPRLDAWARSRLPDPPDALARRLVAAPVVPAAVSVTAIEMPEVPAWELPSRRRRGRLLFVPGVLAAAIAGLLLADVDVQVGRTPATAHEAPRVVAPTVASATVDQAPVSTRPLPTAPLPRRFTWAPAKRASGYDVELFRGSERVFVAETDAPAVEIPSTWTHAGRRRTLEPGTYRWYVWPVTRSGRSARAIVQANFVVEARDS
jgi:hypothetical protein